LCPSYSADRHDRFSPNRFGLDHLSFSVANRAELDKALVLFNEKSVEHGKVKGLAGLGITILPFYDPYRIQLELTVPLAT